MIVVGKDKVINGSNVMSTVAEPQRERVVKEKVKQKVRVLRQRELKKKFKVISSIGVCFVIGVFLIGRYTTIYKNQNVIRNLKSEIETLKYNNDDLRVRLFKFEDINKVSQEAREEFKMITPGVNSMVYSDLTKNNFDNKVESEENKPKEIFEKIKSILF
ncbi:MAG: hypothetical protein RSB70_02780 [Clostridium sp.]